MRGILVERWYLGPLLAAIALMMVSSFEGDHLRIRIEERRLASVENIYRLAFERKFDELRKSGFVDEESVEYLMEQDTLFGPIRSWNVDSDYDGARVQVIRTGLTAHDDMYCSDGASETKPHYSVGSGEYEDFSGRAVSAKSAKQGNRDRPHLHPRAHPGRQHQGSGPAGSDAWLGLGGDGEVSPEWRILAQAHRRAHDAWKCEGCD